MSITRRFQLYTSAILPLALVGCESAEDKLFKPRLAVSHYDAASTHIAVLSVAPWNDMVDKLQPGFTLTGDGALAKTLPVTQLLTSQVLEATNASLQMALPSFSQTRTDTTTSQQATGAAATESRDVTEEERSGPGQLPELGADPAGGRRAKDLPALTLDPNKLENQAVLEYQTAAALYQEVQILNSYVRYAARRTGFTPYLVRLQVTVLPTARNEPYDVVGDISFLPPLLAGRRIGEPASRAESLEESRKNLLLTVGQSTATENAPTVLRSSGAGKPPAGPTADKSPASLENSGADNTPVRIDPTSQPVPFVVPLLVTDDVELSLQSRAVEIVRQLQGALSGQVQNIGFNANAGSLQDQIAAALGNDLNAVSTIGRLNDSTIRVRLGAVNQASNRFSMIPRANTVTLLVLAPNAGALGYPEDKPMYMPVSMRTRLREAVSGKLLPDVTESESASRTRMMKSVADDYRFVGIANGSSCGADGTKDGIIWYLAQMVTMGDYLGFYQCAHNASGTVRDNNLYDALWSDVGAFSSGYGFSTTNVQLLPTSYAILPDSRNVVLLQDDTRLRATARLSGVSGFSAEEVEARLFIGGSAREALAATGIERSGNTVLVTFPSPAAWQIAAPLKGKSAPTLPPDSAIEIRLPNKTAKSTLTSGSISCGDKIGSSTHTDCSVVYNVRYLARASEPDPSFKLVTNVQTVGIEEKATGTYTFGISISSGPITLAADGVAVTAVDKGRLAKDGISWEITGSGRITVSFSQLTPGQSFKLTLRDGAGLSRDISLTAKPLASETPAAKPGANS